MSQVVSLQPWEFIASQSPGIVFPDQVASEPEGGVLLQGLGYLEASIKALSIIVDHNFSGWKTWFGRVNLNSQLLDAFGTIFFALLASIGSWSGMVSNMYDVHSNIHLRSFEFVYPLEDWGLKENSSVFSILLTFYDTFWKPVELRGHHQIKRHSWQHPRREPRHGGMWTVILRVASVNHFGLGDMS